MQITITGADGKMGQQLLKLVSETKNVTLVGAIVQENSPLKGTEVYKAMPDQKSSLLFSCDSENAFKHSDVVIDFTRPAGSLFYASLCAEYGVAHIIGTTGFNEEEEFQLKQYAAKTVIVKSGNMSYGINLLAALVKKAAALLGPDEFDIEISEMHHRLKVDSPSGTALLLGEAAAQGRNKNLKDIASFGHDNNGQARPEGQIGFSAQRGGTVIGDHHVIFAGNNERIILSHLAQDRAIFAKGALKAAFWAIKQKTGLYSMVDVLGL